MATKVIFVTGRNVIEGQGGGSNYVRAHARAAKLAGYDPHLFCFGDENKVVETDFGTVHEVVTGWCPLKRFRVKPGERVKCAFSHWLSHMLYTTYFAHKHAPYLAEGIKEFFGDAKGPYLIHGFFTSSYAGLLLKRSLKEQGVDIKLVNSVYTTAAHEMMGRKRGVENESLILKLFHQLEVCWAKKVVSGIELELYKEADMVLANYKSVEKLHVDAYGKREKFKIIPYSSEQAFISDGFEKLGERASKRPKNDVPVIVSVSRHDPRKGVDVLIKALAVIKDNGLPFRALITSGGFLFSKYKKLAKKLGLTDADVKFEGWVEDSYSYLKEANIFVLPSIEEGSGSLSMLEAMQSGISIVASDIDGIPEDVEDGESALLVPPGDVAALSNALSKVLINIGLRRVLSCNAREAFEGNFAPDIFADALQEVYEDLGFKGKDKVVDAPIETRRKPPSVDEDIDDLRRQLG